MKIFKLGVVTAMVTGMLALAGCGNNSANQSNSTNSASGAMPPGIDTNLPAATNPPAH